MSFDTPTPVKSALRVLELLEFFAEWRRPASVKEVSVSLGYPQSSTSVLLRSLKDAGFFDHDLRTGMYSPNVRLSLATAWIEEQLYSERSLLQMMERVLSLTGHTVMIGTRQGQHVRYLHVLQATRADSFQSKSGLLRPLFRSATGKMLLTTLPEREVVRLLRQANAQEQDVSLRVDADRALADRRQALIDGHAISWGTSVPGAAALAVLLPGSEPMTLSVGGPIDEIKREQVSLLDTLRRAIDPFQSVARTGRFRSVG
jgi:DNA-binding IclR family transcriptional regulator